MTAAEVTAVIHPHTHTVSRLNDMCCFPLHRDQVPVSKQVRTDLYNLNWVADKS